MLVHGLVSGLTSSLVSGIVPSEGGGSSPSLLEQAEALSTPLVRYVASESPGTINTDGTGSEATATDAVGRIPDLSGNGNYCVAGTIATPSDTARATLTQDGSYLAWDFNGTNNYYSLFDPPFLSDIGAIIHVGTRATTGIVTIGLGRNGSSTGTLWFSNNVQYYGLRNTWLAVSADTTTGAIVRTAWRSGANEIIRVNGAQFASAAAAAATVSVDSLGRGSSLFNSGLLHGLIVLPAGVSQEAVEAWEAYAASLNGATLA